ncbi:MAG: cupin domain-containing protein [Candidatus Zapsychrus exili]|nr:cupin domain-containing protein [Candidatus Zapsychrus exili]
MKLYEKINETLANRSLKIINLHRKIVDSFGSEAISHTTLYRALTGKSSLRESSIFQIATALEIKTSELKKNTEVQDKFSIFEYNDNAYLEISNDLLEFLPAKLVIKPLGRTEILQDPQEKGEFYKWSFGLKGEIVCTIIFDDKAEKHTIGKNDTFTFNSTNKHYYENTTNKTASAIVVQNPKYL